MSHLRDQSIAYPWVISLIAVIAFAILLLQHLRSMQQQHQAFRSLKRTLTETEAKLDQETQCLQRISHQQTLYKRLSENAMDCIWLLDLQSYTFEYVSPAVYALRGMSSEEAVGETLEEAFTPESVAKIYRLLNQSMERLMAADGQELPNGVVCQLEQFKKDGTVASLEVSIRMIFEEEGTLKILGVSRDITEKRKLEEKLAQEQEETKKQTHIYEALFKNTRDAIAYFDHEERIVSINDRFSQLFGYSFDEAKGQFMNDIVFSRQGNKDISILPIALETIQASTVELQTIRFHRDGSPINVLAKGVPIYINGVFRGGYGVYTDITPLKETEKKLQLLATTDGLTGLLNRRQFMETANTELRKAKRYQHPLSLILLDIDHFKNVNDAFGHDVGDTVLVLLSSLLKQHARNTDDVFRLGGEEFSMLLPLTNAQGAYLVAERLRNAIENEAFSQGCNEIRFTISLGVAEVSADVHDVDTLFKQADNALYEAKSRGRNQTVLKDT